MLQTFLDTFVLIQGWLLEHIVQPPLLALGFGSYLEAAFDGVEFFLYGVLQLSIAYLLLRPLEHFRPIERWPPGHHPARRLRLADAVHYRHRGLAALS